MPASDDLVITYTATLDEDYLEHGVYKYYKPHNGSKTLAVQRIKGRLISIAVHGNNKVAVKRGTKDVSDKYVCRRLLAHVGSGTRAGRRCTNRILPWG